MRSSADVFLSLARCRRSHEEYLTAYAAATDAAIEAGFVLADDRDAVLAEARELSRWLNRRG